MPFHTSPSQCETCIDSTKCRVETCGPDTNMQTIVSFTCENKDCEVIAAGNKIAEILAEVDKPKPEVKKAKTTEKKKAGRPKKKATK